MIKIFGPENPMHSYEPKPDGEGFTVKEGIAVETNDATFGLAIKAYEDRYSVSIQAYDGSYETIRFKEDEEPKYFVYKRASSYHRLVDIHVIRNGQEYCPKQNLEFRLLEDDIIQIGELVC